MKTIYLTGQNNFGNRGCEALVRSTVDLLRNAFGDVRVLVPSSDAARDARQWPEAASLGVEFVPAPIVPRSFVNWNRLCRRLPFLLRLDWPAFWPDASLAKLLARCDIVLSIGGDNYSLDYDLASLFLFVGIAEYAMAAGRQVVLWGASVGPFGRMPAVERKMLAHLRRLSLITVRESASIAYLAQHDIRDNVLAVTDSAFVMRPEAFDVEPFWPHSADGVLGLNVSPLIERVRAESAAGSTIVDEVVGFLRDVMARTGVSVVLVPHVAPLDANPRNNDEHYLDRILQAAGGATERLVRAPSGLNAAQLKYLISRCDWLIAARTHATIAGFSMAVPTVSIAYSVKAKGINRDLFGHERFVLETPSVSRESLYHAFESLRVEADSIRRQYGAVLEAYKTRADGGASWLASSTGQVITCGAT